MNNTCIYCGTTLQYDRIQALMILGKDPSQFSCLSCAVKMDKPIRGIYTGPSGSSQLILTDKIGAENGPVFEDLLSQHEHEAADFEKNIKSAF